MTKDEARAAVAALVEAFRAHEASYTSASPIDAIVIY